MAKDEIKQVNRGDLALTHSLREDEKIDPKRIKNLSYFGRNVLPGYVVDKKNPSKDFAYFWWYDGGAEYCEDELADLQDQGYEFVKASAPGKEGSEPFELRYPKWQITADGRVKNARYYLMFMPEAEYMERRAERTRHLSTSLDEASEGFHNAAEELGLGTWETRGGRTREGAKAKSTTKLLD